jgi:hypothetical protein
MTKWCFARSPMRGPRTLPLGIWIAYRLAEWPPDQDVCRFGLASVVGVSGWRVVGEWLASGWRVVGEWLASGWRVVGEWLWSVGRASSVEDRARCSLPLIPAAFTGPMHLTASPWSPPSGSGRPSIRSVLPRVHLVAPKESRVQAHLPTKQFATSPQARISCPNREPRRPGGSPGTQAQGPTSPQCLIASSSG